MAQASKADVAEDSLAAAGFAYDALFGLFWLYRVWLWSETVFLTEKKKNLQRDRQQFFTGEVRVLSGQMQH